MYPRLPPPGYTAAYLKILRGFRAVLMWLVLRAVVLALLLPSACTWLTREAIDFILEDFTRQEIQFELEVGMSSLLTRLG